MMLVSERTSREGKRRFISSGHNDAKYLGSAGFLPALQTYVCRWNNTCHNYSNPDKEFNALFVSSRDWFVGLVRFSLRRLWEQVTSFTNRLSTVLSDDEIMGNLTELFSQTSSVNNLTNIWNGIYSSEIAKNFLVIFLLFPGTISTNQTTRNFNQTIPANTLTILFAKPVNLSNLHQPWLINRTNSLSNIEVASEIYRSILQPNSSIVNSCSSLPDRSMNVCLFLCRSIGQKQQSNKHFVQMASSVEPFQSIKHSGQWPRIFSVRIYQAVIWRIFSLVCNNNWICHLQWDRLVFWKDWSNVLLVRCVSEFNSYEPEQFPSTDRFVERGKKFDCSLFRSPNLLTISVIDRLFSILPFQQKRSTVALSTYPIVSLSNMSRHSTLVLLHYAVVEMIWKHISKVIQLIRERLLPLDQLKHVPEVALQWYKWIGIN